jgi:hypothetical protein
VIGLAAALSFFLPYYFHLLTQLAAMLGLLFEQDYYFVLM